MLKVCISGLGRTGCQLAKYSINTGQVQLVSAICSSSSWKAGHDLGEVIGCANIDVPVYSSRDLEKCIFNTKPDVVIDFSQPFSALKNVEIISSLGVKVVMGTTGFTKSDENMLFEIVLRNNSGIVYAPNITPGVNVLMLLSELALRMLNTYDVEIVEMHHKYKPDIPSGTAIKIANEMKNIRKEVKSDSSDISISAVRAGGIISYHKVLLVGENDMIEIIHQPFSRDAFAEGALCAAKFISDKTGVYEMKDVLNYQSVLEDFLNFSENSMHHEVKDVVHM